MDWWLGGKWLDNVGGMGVSDAIKGKADRVGER
jgi:hypothetical protein